MSDEEYMQELVHFAKVQGATYAALIVCEGEIISKSINTTHTNPIAHAEINAIIDSCKYFNSRDLMGCTLYTLVEPCRMCLEACAWARIDRLVFGVPLQLDDGTKVTENDVLSIPMSQVQVNF
jgi:guanine deaminase